MLENARRQVILVLFTIAAAVACIVSLPPQLGTDLRGGVQLIYDVPEDVIEQQLKANPEETRASLMAQTIEVIQRRLDPTGVIDAVITPRGTNGFVIELPSMSKSEEDAAIQRIESLGKLEMRMVADGEFDLGNGEKFKLKEESDQLNRWLNDQGGRALLLDDVRNIEKYNQLPTAAGGPLAYGKLAWFARRIEPNVNNADSWDFSYAKAPAPQSVTAVSVYDESSWNNGTIPEAMKAKPLAERALIELVAINIAEQFFRGEDLSGVSPTQDQNGLPAVMYRLRSDRTSAYGDWSERNIGKASAIILNNLVQTAPTFKDRISTSGVIEGRFTQAEVRELVKVLQAGSLRVEPERQSRNVIGPTLGRESVRLGAWSMAVGALGVFAFMLFYYRMSGVVACVTLLLNMLLLYGAVVFMQATLTMPGIGGMVLTLGMAVDANVLIYERIKEEVKRGKDLERAVRAGFERAMSAILDSNVTTFLAGLVLYNVGIGPIRGFAVTLMIGIGTTVFTQFFVTRLVFHYLIERKWITEYRTAEWFRTLNFDFVRRIRTCVTASAIAIGAGLVFMLTQPREVLMGLDFTGGANLTMVLEQPTTGEAVLKQLQADAPFSAQFHSPQVNTVGRLDEEKRSQSLNIKLKLTNELRREIDEARDANRKARAAADEKGEPLPDRYVPPYVDHLKRIFAAELVKPAFTDAKVIELPNGTGSAQLRVHSQSLIGKAAALQKLQEAKLPEIRVTVPGNETATESRELFLEWNVLATTVPTELPAQVTDAFAELTDTAGNPVVLSDPFPEAEEIQGRMIGKLRSAAIGALLLSWALIVLYLRARFHEYKYGIAALVSLVHDVLVTLVAVSFFTAMGWVNAEIDLNMIACFLTIIGYSVNDTIVIFDRIRENLREQEATGVRESYQDLINRSINQTLSRTILTNMVTLFVVIAQFAVNWGSGSSLESFSFAMIVGMLSGTYSTIYIAAPLLIVLHRREAAKAPPPAHPQQDPAMASAT